MKGLANYPASVSDKHITVCNDLNWMTLDPSTTHITVGRNCSNDASLTVLDLSRFQYLKELVVGDESFMYVNEVKLIGLHYLESVVIGMNSFTRSKNGYGQDPNRHFYLKNCPMLKSLKMGRYSLSDYTVIEIENVNALEAIEMGNANNLEAESYNFHSASLELRSILIHNE